PRQAPARELAVVVDGRRSDAERTVGRETHRARIVALAGRRAPSQRGSVVRQLVDANDRGDDQRVVLARLDLDSIGVARAEPALRDLGDLLAVALDLVLVLDEVALRLQLLAALDLDRKPAPERVDQCLLDGRSGLTVTLDVHRPAQVHDL